MYDLSDEYFGSSKWIRCTVTSFQIGFFTMLVATPLGTMAAYALYVSGHPLLEHAEDLEEFTTVSFEEGQDLSKNDTISVGGMITKIIRRYDRRKSY